MIKEEQNLSASGQQFEPRHITVTHVSKWFPPDIGGLEQHVYYVTSNLARFGVHCRILALKSRKPVELDYTRMEGLSIRRVGHYVMGPPTFSKLLRHYKSFIQWSREMLKCQENSEILHFHAPSLWFKVSPWHDINPQWLLKKIKMLSKPTVVTFHGLRLHYESKYVHLDQMDVESGTVFIGVDKNICHDLHSHFGLPIDRIFYIPNGVDTQLFFPLKNHLALKKRLFKDLSPKVILLPRRIDPKNGIIQAIEAFSKIIKDHKNVRLLILGFENHPLFPKYEKKVLNKIMQLKLEKYVLLHQAVPYRLMPKYYNISYISLIPSLWEATSLSALESLACGVPVLASNTGGLPEVVTNEVGLLNKPGNVNEIEKNMRNILENPQMHESMSKKAIALSERRNWKANAKKVMYIYKKILNFK